ncbi:MULTISPECIES: PKD domain-containing protein [unclassified Methanoregula]|uniref:PKD domain-containing protein n=1 Tax=unclassified Methanoregula TaxID=2649730 RepID=UPI0025F83BE3|nr:MULTISPECIES: PKD domain-containing protein [unclassified Methanoregula]
MLYLNKVWRTVTPDGNLSIIPVSAAINKLQRGIILNPKKYPYNINITKIRLGYYEKGRGEGQEYLEPVWLFRGTDDAGDPIKYYVYARQFANFTVYPSTEVTKYQPVYFVDQSETNVTRWFWDFGDGTNSTEQNPGHLYRTGGNYTVNLTVWNAMGSDTISRPEYIWVNYGGAAPVANFSSNYSWVNHYPPLAITFSDTSGGTNLTRYWDFGDGTNSTDVNPVHLYTLPDDMFYSYYLVNLTVNDEVGRVSSYSDYIFVQINLTPDFTAEPRIAGVNETITFTDLTPRGNWTYGHHNQSYCQYWDFGDGTQEFWWPGNHQIYETPPVSVTHEFQDAGNFTISLSTDQTNDCESMTTTSKNITILSNVTPLKPEFSANVTRGRTPLAVGFADESEGSPTHWNWSFGDGTWSDDENPDHFYSAAGTYTVSLTASNPYEENTSTKVGYITVYDPLPPVANFTANVTSGYEPLAVAFTDISANGPEQWNWSFGDGAYSAEQYPVHEYLRPGVYSVSLEIASEYGTDTMIRTDYITVIGAYPTETISVPPPLPPEADFTGAPVSGKVPLTVQFNDKSFNYPIIWFWDFGDGTTGTVKDPIHTYTSAGSYTVSLNATNNEGMNTTVKTDYITVLPLTVPVAGFSANTTSGNAPLAVGFTDESTGSPESWSWSFGDGTTSDDQNPEHVYSGTGTYTVSLTVTSPDGSNTTTKTEYITVTTNVPPPVANFTGKPTCGKAPLSVKFSDASTGNPTRRFWDFGDGTNATEQNPVHVYTSRGKYTVTLTAANAGGSDTKTRIDYISVSGTVKPPVANFYSKPTSGKAPLFVKFTDTSYGSPTGWYWDFGDNTNATDRNPVHSYATPGRYSVSLTVTNSAGSNTKTRTEYITVKGSPPPAANFYGKPTSGKTPLSVKFTDTSTGNPTEWLWDFGDGTTDTVRHPIHRYLASGKYTVSLTTSNAAGNTTKIRTDYITVKSVSPTPTHTCTTKPTTTATQSQCEPYEIPQVTGTTENGMIRLDWDVIMNPCLQGYKVVISKNNPNPKYPDDGYMFWITDRNRNFSVVSSTDHYNGGDFGGYLRPGQTYYFSITAVYTDTKVAGNVVMQEYPV